MYKNSNEFFKPWRKRAFVYGYAYLFAAFIVRIFGREILKPYPSHHDAFTIILSLPVFYFSFRAERGPNRKLIPEDDLPDGMKRYFGEVRGTALRILLFCIPFLCVACSYILTLNTLRLPTFVFLPLIVVFCLSFLILLILDGTFGHKHLVQYENLKNKRDDSPGSKEQPNQQRSASTTPLLKPLSLSAGRINGFRALVFAASTLINCIVLANRSDGVGYFLFFLSLTPLVVHVWLTFKMYRHESFYPPVEELPRYLILYTNWVARPTWFAMTEMFPVFMMFGIPIFNLGYPPLRYLFFTLLIGISVIIGAGLVLGFTLGLVLRLRFVRESKCTDSSRDGDNSKTIAPYF